MEKAKNRIWIWVLVFVMIAVVAITILLDSSSGFFMYVTRKYVAEYNDKTYYLDGNRIFCDEEVIFSVPDDYYISAFCLNDNYIFVGQGKKYTEEFGIYMYALSGELIHEWEMEYDSFDAIYCDNETVLYGNRTWYYIELANFELKEVSDLISDETAIIYDRPLTGYGSDIQGNIVTVGNWVLIMQSRFIRTYLFNTESKMFFYHPPEYGSYGAEVPIGYDENGIFLFNFYYHGDDSSKMYVDYLDITTREVIKVTVAENLPGQLRFEWCFKEGYALIEQAGIHKTDNINNTIFSAVYAYDQTQNLVREEYKSKPKEEILYYDGQKIVLINSKKMLIVKNVADGSVIYKKRLSKLGDNHYTVTVVNNQIFFYTYFDDILVYKLTIW